MFEFPTVAAIIVALIFVALLAFAAPQQFLPVVVAVGVLTSRPTAIGERYPLLGAAILTAAGIGCLILQVRTKQKTPIAPMVIFALAWFWLMWHEFLVPGSEPNLGTSWLTFLAPVLGFGFIGRDKTLLERTRRMLVGIIAGTAILTSVAIIVGALIGYTTLHLGSVGVGYERISSGLLFPGALTYGPDVGSGIPRFLGLGREPGMGAVFLGWAFFAMPRHWAHRSALRVALLIALAGTQSTAGIGVFAVCATLYFVFGRKTFSPAVAIAALIAGAITVWVAVFNPSFGFLAKGGAPSFVERNSTALAGVRAFIEQPFTATSDAPLSSVNLIASAAVNGAPWVVLMVIFFALPIVRAGRKNVGAYSSLFILVIMLTSQPTAGATAILVLSLIDYYSSRPSESPAMFPRMSTPPGSHVQNHKAGSFG